MFNTLKYARKLESVGFTREQSEAHVQIIAEILESEVATKTDLKELEYRLVIRLSAILGTIVTIAISLAVALTASLK